MSAKKHDDPRDSRDSLVSRGSYGSSPVGRTTFIGLRTADIVLQYSILAKHLADPLLNLLNISQVPNFAPAVAFGLPLRPLLILAMAAGSSFKQSYWVAFVAREEMKTGSAVAIAVFNTVFNSINSILSLTAAANAFTPSFLTNEDDNGVSILLIASTVACFVGMGIEAVCEQQRKAFKDNPKNEGKPFTGGLFGLARHVNYFGYTVWRGSYALASGGWLWAGFVVAFFSYDFLNRGIPVLDDYCSKRYGASWTEYKKKVPYKFVPGLL